MQFILDNQIRRQEPTVGQLGSEQRIARTVEAALILAFDSSEEGSHLSCPRQGSKLVDGRNHEARKPSVDRFIHSYDGQPRISGKRALRPHTLDQQICRVVLIWD